MSPGTPAMRCVGFVGIQDAGAPRSFPTGSKSRLGDSNHIMGPTYVLNCL